MDTERNTNETPKQPTAGASGSAIATAQHILERGSKVYGQAEQAVSDAYDQTAQAETRRLRRPKDLVPKIPAGQY